METGQPFVLVDVPAATPPILAVAQGLSTRGKWVLVWTNIPYWCVAIATLNSPAVQSVAPACVARICASVLFHGCILTTLASVSTIWHLGALSPPALYVARRSRAPRVAAAQCQLLECCRGVEKADGEASLVAMLKRLLVSDILCSVLSFAVGLVCFSPVRTIVWLAGPFLVFLVARRAKVRREHETYALLHGLWHVLSAVAIWQIVFTPFAFLTT